jgi:hypothetical protein
MTRKLAGAVATLLLVAALAVAGCGGGNDNASTSTTPGAELTKAQYIAAADKVCKATTDKINAAATKLRESANKTGTIAIPRVTKFLTETSLPSYEAMLAQLRTLTPPKQDEKAIDGLIAALAGAIDTAKADPTKYSKNDAPDPFDDANSRAIDYGMKVCGS